jgi:hypothetical protein
MQRALPRATQLANGVEKNSKALPMTEILVRGQCSLMKEDELVNCSGTWLLSCSSQSPL